MKKETKKTLLYDIISAAAILLFCASFLFNIGWYRLFLGFFIALMLCVFMFLGCHYVSKTENVKKAKRLSIVSYITFISAQIIMPDCNDEQEYLFFGLLRRTEESAIFFVLTGLSVALFIVNVIVIIIQLATYKRFRANIKMLKLQTKT